MSGGFAGFMLGHDRQRDGEHGGARRSLRSGAARLSGRADGRRLLHRLHQRAHHHGLPEHMDADPRRRLGAADRVHQEREPAASTRWRSRPPCAAMRGCSARTRTRGASSRCCTTSTTSAGRRRASSRSRASRSCGAGYPEWVIRAILSHADYSGVAARVAAREDAVRLRRDGRLRHRGGAGASEQERAGPRGRVGGEADEGQGVRQGVKRDDLRRGAELLGLPLDEHIGNVIGFMRERADDARAARRAVSAQ